MSHRRPNKKPVRVESKINCNLNFQEYLKDRNLGNPNKIGFNDSLNFKLFGSIRHVEFEKVTEPTTERGGIFNLEFSLDGYEIYETLSVPFTESLHLQTSPVGRVREEASSPIRQH